MITPHAPRWYSFAAALILLGLCQTGLLAEVLPVESVSDGKGSHWRSGKVYALGGEKGHLLSLDIHGGPTKFSLGVDSRLIPGPRPISLVLQNFSEKRAVLGEIAVSCSCLEFKGVDKDVVIPPGQARVFSGQIHWNRTSLNHSDGRLSFTLSGPDDETGVGHQAEFRVESDLYTPITFTPETLKFQTIKTDQVSSQKVESLVCSLVRVESPFPFTRIRVEDPNNLYQTALVETSKGWDITVTPQLDVVAIGNRSTVLRVHLEDDAGMRWMTVPLMVKGRARGPISFWPQSLILTEGEGKAHASVAAKQGNDSVSHAFAIQAKHVALEDGRKVSIRREDDRIHFTLPITDSKPVDEIIHVPVTINGVLTSLRLRMMGPLSSH